MVTSRVKYSTDLRRDMSLVTKVRVTNYDLIDFVNSTNVSRVHLRTFLIP